MSIAAHRATDVEYPGMSYDEFCQHVQELTGLQLACYKRLQMERRTRTFALRLGMADLGELITMIATDARVLRDFLDHVTVNVSEFFRDPPRFTDIARFVIPTLLHDEQKIAIWSAGCANGAEAYSAALLMLEYFPEVPYTIWATDIDAQSLARAEAGLYTEDMLQNVPLPILTKFFHWAGKGFQIAPVAREHVTFAHHDLLRDPFPTQQSLILCRNVIIYLAPEVKIQMFARFQQALRPKGFLLLGETERIIEERTLGYQQVHPHLYMALPRLVDTETYGEAYKKTPGTMYGRRKEDGGTDGI